MSAGNYAISKHQRRRALCLAHLNGALWSLGNGLASTSLLVYMIKQLGASETAVGVILAAPHLVGALRIGAPALVGRAGSRKSLCLFAYGLSAIVLAAISQLAEPRQLTSPSMSLGAIVVLWCLYHLLEYIGTVYLWAWLGDLAPRRIRGRFLGHRERWMLLARIVGMVGGGAFSYYWLEGDPPRSLRWMAYAVPACLGAGSMMTAIVPLLRMPEPQTARPAPPPIAETLLSAIRPLADVNMLWLLAFGMWFSLANGLTQAAQYSFPITVFALSLFARQALEATMRGAQSLSAPHVGGFADRFGNRQVLIISQLIVALAPLSLFIASRTAQGAAPANYAAGSPWWSPATESWFTHGGFWLCLTWAFFIAYVGLNIGLPNLMLKLAAPSDRASYIAWYFAITGVVYGLCTIAGGWLYEQLKAWQPELELGVISLDYNELLFLAGFLLRANAVVWLLPIVEPLRSKRTS
jgi:MFS family permease